jgi:hypothetical protein
LPCRPCQVILGLCDPLKARHFASGNNLRRSKFDDSTAVNKKISMRLHRR